MFIVLDLYGGEVFPNPTEYRIMFQGKYLAAIWIFV